MIRMGVIGYGYWGPNLVRNISETPNAELVAVCDARLAQLQQAKARYPAIQATTDSGEVIHDPNIDAVVIATPVDTHFDLAMAALEAGKHVLIEKPMTSTSGQSKNLVEMAAKKSRILMVDHTFIYTGAVRKIRELVQKGDLGEVYYYDSVRINLGLFQRDVSVLWDLAVHDLAILDYIFDEKPVAVSATGISHVPGQPENTAYLTMFFNGNKIAHVHVSWLAPVKIRRTLIGGSLKMIVYDDLEPSEKIKVYDKGITLKDDPDNVYKMKVGYRAGDMWCPNLDTTEALRTGMRHFTDCIDKNETPLTSGEAGWRVVRTLEAATESMADKGRLVQI